MPAPRATPDSCQTLRKHGQKTEAQACYESLVRSNSAYLRAEGYWGLEQYDQANEQFASRPRSRTATALYRVRWGMLLHERFNNTDAVDCSTRRCRRIPKNAQAYLGLAMVSADGFDSKAPEYAGKASQLDPKLVEAHELLANLRWRTRIRRSAIAEADEALALSPDALDAMAIQAAVELLADRSAGRVVGQDRQGESRLRRRLRASWRIIWC